MAKSNKIVEKIFKAYGDPKPIDLAKALGVDRATISKWVSGIRSPTMEQLSKIVKERGVTWDWILDGTDPEGKAREVIIETKVFADSWPVRGLAAADESGGTRVPDTDDFDDPIHPPEGLTCIPIRGNSMSPLLLDGQYAMIDSQREGFEVDGGIVVAYICEPSTDDERREPMTGTFVKRCYEGDGIYYFTSINEYSPFSAWIDHCRIWPVLGTWFAGRGRPPED